MSDKVAASASASATDLPPVNWGTRMVAALKFLYTVVWGFRLSAPGKVANSYISAKLGRLDSNGGAQRSYL